MDSSIPIPFLTWASLPPRQRPAPLPGPSGYKPTAKWMWVYLLFLPLLPLSNNLLFLPLSILSACFAFLFGLYCLCSLLSAHLDWWSHSKLPQNSEMGHGTSTPAWPASPARHPGEHTASQSLRILVYEEDSASLPRSSTCYFELLLFSALISLRWLKSYTLNLCNLLKYYCWWDH